MYVSTILKYEPIRSLDSSTLTGSYLPIGTPLADASRILKIVNTSNVTVTISTDGVNDMDIIPSGSFVLYDAGTNRGNAAPCMTFAKGEQFYAKGSVGAGLIYVVSLYGYTNSQTPSL